MLGSAQTLFSWAWKSYYPKSHYSNRWTDPYLKYVYSLSLSNGNNRNGIAIILATHIGMIPIAIAMISIAITDSNMYMLMFGFIYLLCYIRAGVVLLALPEAHLDLVTGSLNVIFPLWSLSHLAWVSPSWIPLVAYGIWFGTNLPSYLHLYYMKSKSKNQPKSKNSF